MVKAEVDFEGRPFIELTFCDCSISIILSAFVVVCMDRPKGQQVKRLRDAPLSIHKLQASAESFFLPKMC